MTQVPTAHGSAIPALSIRQPWAWFILHAGKRLENRDWSDRYPPIRFRGEFLIHAAAGMTRDELSYGDAFARQCGWRPDNAEVSNFQHAIAYERGGIVGRARVVGWIEESKDPWFMGPGALVLEDVQELPFTPCKGALGFFYPQNIQADRRGV